MCYDGGVGHSGENKMAKEFKKDYEKLPEKERKRVTLRDFYEDACYNLKKKTYFPESEWPAQLKYTTGTIQTLFYYQHSAILTYMSRVLVVLEWGIYGECYSSYTQSIPIPDASLYNRKKLQSL